MMMKRLGWRTVRGIGRAILAVLSLTAATSAFGAVVLNPFPPALSLARNVPPSSVVARVYLTPQQLCGERFCKLVQFRPNQYIDNCCQAIGVTGPTITTLIKSLDARAIVNERPQTLINEGGKPIEFHRPIEIQLLRNNSAEFVNREIQNKTLFFIFTTTLTGTNYTQHFIDLTTKLTVIEGTCSVPSQTVKLPSAATGDLNGIGTTAGAHTFQIHFNNCPKGYNKVLYRLKPMGAINRSPGVLSLSADSTAKGVMLKVSNNLGGMINFDSLTAVERYNKATGGSYSIQMRVSYIQTEANVTPGTANWAMTVLMEYQ